ncbi:restriction endonuclease subunit S [Paenibacillus sp. SEL3]
MTEQTNLVPKRRFKEFQNTQAWEQRKFEDMFDYSIPNNTLSRAELNYGIGEIKSVHYGDILIKYGAVTDVAKDEIPFITNGDITKYKSHLLKNGDIILADTAEDETVGKATEIVGIGDECVVSGLHTIVCRPKADMQENYLGYYMNSSAYHRQLLPLMQGVKVLAISRSNLAKTTVSYPVSSEEQRNIGKIFAHLDNLITLHQHKLEKTKALKSAYLSEMFLAEGERLPKRRFAGFTRAWEQRELNTITDVRDGTHDSPQYFLEGHPFVTSKNIKDGHINYDDIQYISNADFVAINRRSKVDKNDILMGMIGTIGNIALVRETPDFAIKNVALIKDTKRVYHLFLYHYLQSPSISKQLEEGMDGGTQKFVSLNKIRNLSIAVPESDEQYKLGNFFDNLDNLISLQQRKLEKLQNIKKAYLNEMFI